VLMVTHEPEMAAFAGRIVRFVDGRVADDRPNGALADTALADAKPSTTDAAAVTGAAGPAHADLAEAH
jgi:hypothetical protein